jgi:DNA-directed RNA polymerase subunit RPC12/RpoP
VAVSVGLCFYWCHHCHRQTEPADNDHGEAGLRCARCHSPRVEMRRIEQPWHARPGAARQHKRVKLVTVERAAELFSQMREVVG